LIYAADSQGSLIMSDLSVAVANDLMEVVFKRNPQPLEALAACILLIGHVLARLEEKDRAAVIGGLMPMIKEAMERAVEAREDEGST
jgi:hypothetical protein